jgi:hypothetical protein
MRGATSLHRTKQASVSGAESPGARVKGTSTQLESRKKNKALCWALVAHTVIPATEEAKIRRTAV